MTIAINDDGSGLNIDAINKRAALGRPLTEAEIIERIFDPGFSTKESASMYSGRGVGMGAVKSYLENFDCDIHLDFHDEIKDSGFCKFTLCIHIHSKLLLGDDYIDMQKVAS